MPKFDISAVVEQEVYLGEVEAEDEDEARLLAEREAFEQEYNFVDVFADEVTP